MAKKGTLEQWRSFAGLSRRELAEKITKSEKTIQNWETGETQPNAEDIKELEKALNIKWADVLLVGKDLRKTEE